MFSSNSFSDLSICATKIPELTEICETSFELGYRTVAVNQIIGEPQFVPKKKKKKLDAGEAVDEVIPEPIGLNELQKTFAGKLTILNRLTFEFSDQQQIYNVLQHSSTKKYDLLAAIPKSQAAFHYLCTAVPVDIMSFDPMNKHAFKMSRKMYNVAARHGLHFELMYVPAESDGIIRQNIISKAHQYYYFGKSKNIIISSNASFPFQIRGPYDVIHIGLLFGLSEQQSKFAISDAGRKAYLRAGSRKLGKCAPILVEHSGVEDEEQDVDLNIQSHKKRPRTS